jgi:thiol-disulfide isomerase/thioredoxin
MSVTRRADPWRDTDVIDSRAPRTNQAVVGTLSLIAFATGWWPILGLLAAQLGIGLRFGRRWCLPCLFYFDVLQPRFGEGPIEDSRPPRFANMVGVVFLGSATLAHAIGLTTIGWGLGLIVSALALLAATTGLCVGCEMYKIGARLRGIRPGRITHVDLDELGAERHDGETVIQFTHPLCTDCRTLEHELRAAGGRFVAVDVSKRPELARKYGISLVPTAVAVGPEGFVTRRIA